ncbi:MAG: helix-turn-helix transcriptional regulator [Planctomycetes bacterium]|nr:helix-turn-helix transcriptional regulator [Planctomycetota bacterium]
MEIVSPDLLTLARLRGNIPVMAALDGSPRGFSQLADALDLSRDTLSRSLKALQPKWVRHAGDYRLTAAGTKIAPVCGGILELAVRIRQKEVLLRRWTLPVAAALRHWSLHFGELRAMLPGITPRALTLALKEMAEAGLVAREIEMSFPPSAIYRLTGAAERLLPLIGRI